MSAFKAGQIYKLREPFKNFDHKVFPPKVYIINVHKKWTFQDEKEEHDIRYCNINEFIGRTISMEKFDLYYEFVDVGEIFHIEAIKIGDLIFGFREDEVNDTIVFLRRESV